MRRGHKGTRPVRLISDAFLSGDHRRARRCQPGFVSRGGPQTGRESVSKHGVVLRGLRGMSPTVDPRSGHEGAVLWPGFVEVGPTLKC
jgi:hypothetical protein